MAFVDGARERGIGGEGVDDRCERVGGTEGVGHLEDLVEARRILHEAREAVDRLERAERGDAGAVHVLSYCERSLMFCTRIDELAPNHETHVFSGASCLSESGHEHSLTFSFSRRPTPI